MLRGESRKKQGKKTLSWQQYNPHGATPLRFITVPVSVCQVGCGDVIREQGSHAAASMCTPLFFVTLCFRLLGSTMKRGEYFRSLT